MTEAETGNGSPATRERVEIVTPEPSSLPGLRAASPALQRVALDLHARGILVLRAARVRGRAVGHMSLYLSVSSAIAPLLGASPAIGDFLATRAVSLVTNLEVDPAHRRQGIASALVADAAHTARSAGARTLAALVDPTSPSTAFYQSLGFDRHTALAESLWLLTL
ncbi:MAG: GNAT family N-acetyltransferase [Deltaproteobacteria bacterium]|nr:GNAT family N-acetyltransferase [Deltaproteobacteria bacterium]